MKILMVCLGNICRSPLAHGILKSKLGESFFVDSAGTISLHQGETPDIRSIETARKHGIEIGHYQSRSITQRDLEDFDLIFCMDRSNLSDVLKLAKNEEQISKISLILPQQQEVPDPYYGTLQDFEKVYFLLDEACQRVAKNLKS